MKRTLIVKEPKARVKVFDSHLEISTFYETQYVGFSKMTSVYIHKHVRLNMADAFRIAEHVPLYFIDKRGNILGKFIVKK